TDDQRDLRSPGSIAHWNAKIAWLPGLHRYPGMELTVVEPQLALRVNNDATVVRIAMRIVLHERETAPDAIVRTRTLEGRHLRTIQPAQNLRPDVHGKPVQRVLGEYDQVHARHVPTRLGDHRTDSRCLTLQIRGSLHHR